MLHESCDIVADAGGWTCRTCRAHWRTSFEPDSCADDRIPDGTTDRAALMVLVTLGVGAVLCLGIGLAGGLAP